MSKTAGEYLADIAAKVAESDAKADAELADILAGRTHKKRAPAAPAAAASTAPAVKKPRARRKPAAKRATADENE